MASVASYESKDDSSEVLAQTTPTVDGLTSEQASQAHAVFSKADVDGGGTLDRKELQGMFSQLGLILTSRQMEEYVDSHALLADKDDDGIITFKEFLALYAAVLLPQRMFGQDMRMAAGRGDLHAVEDFMRRGCDARFADGKGWTAVHYAAEYDHPEVISLIQQLAVDMATERRRMLQSAAARSEQRREEEAAAAAANAKGKTVLKSPKNAAEPAGAQRSASDLSADDVEALVDIDSPDKHGWTPLATACSAGHVRIVRLLLDMGADANHGTKAGLTPLHSAASGGRVHIVQALLAAGADITAQDTSGFTPLHLAAMGDCTEVCSVLIAAGAPLHGPAGQDVLGNTPLDYAHGDAHEVGTSAHVLSEGMRAARQQEEGESAPPDSPTRSLGAAAASGAFTNEGRAEPANFVLARTIQI